MEIYNFLTTNAILQPFTQIITVIGIVAILAWANKAHNTLGKVSELLAAEHGNPKSHFVMLQDVKKQTESIEDMLQAHIPQCNEHFTDIDKMASLEQWQNCPMDKCSAISKILNTYQELKARFELFEVMATESRNRTQESLADISSELTELSKELIVSLREDKRRR